METLGLRHGVLCDDSGRSGCGRYEEPHEYSVKTLTDQGIRVQKLTEVSGNWEESRGKELTEQALKRYGRRVEVIICNNDAMANGASEAIQEAGRVVGKDICLVGVDGLKKHRDSGPRWKCDRNGTE